MESRLPRFRLTDHHPKDSPSRSHISPPFESYSSRQPLLQDSGLPVVEFSKRQDATKKHNQESRERGDSKIPVSTTLAKSSSLQEGSQRIHFCEQRTTDESRQDRINSFKLDSVIQSKPNEIFTFVQRSSGRSGQGSRGHCLPREALKVTEKQNDEAHAAERLGKRQLFASSRVLELRRIFEACDGEQGKRRLERQNIRKEDVQERHLKEELNQQKTDYTASILDIGRHNEPLANETDSTLEQPDLAVFPPQQQSISNKSPYRRWTWMYPRSTLSLPSTQHPSAVKKKNQALCRQGRLDQRFESCENMHGKHSRGLVVIEETMHEQLPFRKKPTSTDEQFLENGNGKANIDSGDGNSYDGSISLHNLRNSNREAIETKSGERSLKYSRTGQAAKNLDQPRCMDGAINPVGRVHSEPLTPSSLIKSSRPESPRRRIFETKSDKMVSQTAYSSHTGEKKEEEEEESSGRDKGGSLSKQRNECQDEVHRSLTDHRAEGMRVFARNKSVCHRTTTFNDSTRRCKLHQKSDESAHCINAGSRLEQDALVGENYQLSGVVEDNEAIELVAETQVINADERKDAHVTELASPVHDGRLLSSTQPSSSERLQPLTDLAHNRECPATVDRYCSRPDCSSSGNQLTGRSTYYGSIGDFYLSSSTASARRIPMSGSTASDYLYRLSPSDGARSETKKKAWLSFDSESPVDSSPYGVQLRLSPSSQSMTQAHPKQTTKASCEPSKSKLKTVDGIAADPIQHLLCYRTTSEEAFAKQMAKAIESDNCLLQRQSKVPLKAARHNSATSFTAIHCIPNEAAAQFSANFAENDEHMETTFDDDMSEDRLEMKNHLEFPRSSHLGQIGQNENMMSCTEFIDLLEEDKPIEYPVRNSVVSVKPVNGVISMYRTQGPIIAKFSDRVKTVDLSRSRYKTALVLPKNTPSRKRDLCQLQTVALETCKPTMNQTKPILRSSDFLSKPQRKLIAEKGDEHVRKYDDRHQIMFRQQPRWPKARQKRQLHANLPTSCSTDSFTTDCELSARSLPAQVQHPWNTLRRRRHSNNGPKIINTRASASRIDDSASSVGSSANFRRAFRQLRQQLAEELDETSSIEELVRGYDHPLYLSENESDVDDHKICGRSFNVEISNSLANTSNEGTVLIEQESTSTVITRQIQTDQGMQILPFRQHLVWLLIAIILIIIFHTIIFPIFENISFRKSDS